MTETLTKPELSRRTKLERTIQETQGAFVSCGIALAEIRDSKLYRSTHGTFESYCEDVWGWTQRRAYQLIDAAQIVNELPKKSEQLFTNEGQIRELRNVPKEQRPTVIEKVAKLGKVTAKKIREVAAKVIAPIEELRDHTKAHRLIPDNRREAWQDATRVGKEIRDAGRLWKQIVDDHIAIGDEHKRLHNLSDAMAVEIGQLVHEIGSRIIPYALCPFCQGKLDRCEKCHSRGWVSKLYWNQFVDVKLKTMIENNGAQQ